MIKLIAWFKRREGMTPGEFHAYWRQQHGPLVMSTRSGRHALRYEQNHRVLSTYRSDDDRDGFDGVTEQWFESVEDFYASLQEDDYRLIDEDVAKFIDPASIQFVLADEPEVVA
jgi:uncharacterized protein (TIGR02118 family)